jgi:hypothetical protein
VVDLKSILVHDQSADLGWRFLEITVFPAISNLSPIDSDSNWTFINGAARRF